MYQSTLSGTSVNISGLSAKIQIKCQLSVNQVSIVDQGSIEREFKVSVKGIGGLLTADALV